MWKVWITLCSLLSKKELCKLYVKGKCLRKKGEKCLKYPSLENCVDFCPKVKLTKDFLKKGKKAEKMENRRGSVKTITLCIISGCKVRNKRLSTVAGLCSESYLIMRGIGGVSKNLPLRFAGTSCHANRGLSPFTISGDCRHRKSWPDSLIAAQTIINRLLPKFALQILELVFSSGHRHQIKKETTRRVVFFFWCRWPDSNRHAVASGGF